MNQTSDARLRRCLRVGLDPLNARRNDDDDGVGFGVCARGRQRRGVPHAAAAAVRVTTHHDDVDDQDDDDDDDVIKRTPTS